MKIVKKVEEFKKIRNNLKGKIGFVPTMGALHQGHISLIKKSKEKSDITVVSIFVNPTQFNNKEDFQKYPITIEKDIKILKHEKVDFLFLPDYKEIYPDDYKYKVIETDFSKILCGKFRPGHFDGVLTVVMKLFNIIKPDYAFFGEKDYQQLVLINGMVKAFFMDVEIVSCPTVRENDGLAASSRNLRLCEKERKIASLIYQTIRQKISDRKVKEILNKNGFRVEYVKTIEKRRFIAAWLGNVRLIDNCIIGE